MINSLQKLYSRDLNKLKDEIQLYRDERNLWKVEPNILNSGGNLCLHLIGNLNTYIGNGLANIKYVRNRTNEFSLKNVPKSELIEKVEETHSIVEKGLLKLSEDELNKEFPIVIWDKPTRMDFTLIHLHSHLNYHLGQINYHRRLIEK